MTSYYLNPSGTDFDDLFEPASNGNGVADGRYLRADGSQMTYAALRYGSAVAATDYLRSDGGGDVNTLWAAKGSVAQLQAFPLSNFSVATESLTWSDLLYGDIIVNLNNDGTGSISSTTTNYVNDNVPAYDPYGIYNYSNGRTLANFQYATAPIAGFGNAFTADVTVAGQTVGWIDYPTTNSNQVLYPCAVTIGYQTNGTTGSQTGYIVSQSGIKGYGGAYISGIGVFRNANKSFSGQYLATSGLDLSSNVSVGAQFQGLGDTSLSGYHDNNAGVSWYYQVTITIKITSKTNPSQSVSSTTTLRMEIRWQQTSYTPPAAPSPSGGGGTGGGGGCVVVDAEMFDGAIAFDYGLNRRTLVTDPYAKPNDQASFYGDVEYSEPKLMPCVEVELASGAVLKMSKSAEIPTEKGGFQYAENLLGHAVPAAHESQFDVYREGELPSDPSEIAWQWDEVVVVRDIGLQLVQHLTIAHHHHCFWARSGGKWFILHHNLKAAQGAV